MKKKPRKQTKPSKTKSPTRAGRAGLRGGSIAGEARKCSVCTKRGHNARSHLPGGKLAKS